MAYWLGIYAPQGVGIESLSIYDENGRLLGTCVPKGLSETCFSRSGITTGVRIVPTLKNGVSVARWVVNADGTRYEQYETTCSIGYVASVKNLQIRLEVSGTPVEPYNTYYAHLTFDANGGTGAPATQYGNEYNNTGYVTFTLPSAIPTKSGYTFAGWLIGSITVQAGGTVAVYGTTAYPGQGHTCTAQWVKKAGDGTHIMVGAFQRYQAWINVGSYYSPIWVRYRKNINYGSYENPWWR